jgi:hypothetical protein
VTLSNAVLGKCELDINPVGTGVDVLFHEPLPVLLVIWQKGRVFV